MTDVIRYYVVLRAKDEPTKDAYKDPDPKAISDIISQAVYGREFDEPPFAVRARPSHPVSSTFDQGDLFDKLDRLVVALDVTGGGGKISREVVKDFITAAEKKPDIFAGSSPDLAFNSTDHWCIGEE